MGRRNRRRNRRRRQRQRDEFTPSADSDMNLLSSLDDYEDLGQDESFVDYIKRKRHDSRQRINFHVAEKFLLATQDKKYNLSAADVEWFFPSQMEKPDWNYQRPAAGTYSQANREYLESRIEDDVPDQSIYDKEELDMLLARDAILRHPPIYYLS